MVSTFNLFSLIRKNVNSSLIILNPVIELGVPISCLWSLCESWRLNPKTNKSLINKEDLSSPISMGSQMKKGGRNCLQTKQAYACINARINSNCFSCMDGYALLCSITQTNHRGIARLEVITCSGSFGSFIQGCDIYILASIFVVFFVLFLLFIVFFVIFLFIVFWFIRPCYVNLGRWSLLLDSGY